MNLYVLAFHIIFVVTWFAGLFYIVRLFIYHAEAEKKTEPERSILQKQYKLMEKRLWYGITWPSMLGTYILGGWLLYESYGINMPAWLLLKLAFVGFSDGQAVIELIWSDAFCAPCSGVSDRRRCTAAVHESALV